MLNQLQTKPYSHRLQVEFRTLSKICKKLYYKYAPSRLTHRRNDFVVWNLYQTTKSLHYLSGKLKKVYLLSEDLPVAGDFAVFLGLVLIAGLERFLASLLRSSTI